MRLFREGKIKNKLTAAFMVSHRRRAARGLPRHRRPGGDLLAEGGPEGPVLDREVIGNATVAAVMFEDEAAIQEALPP